MSTSRQNNLLLFAKALNENYEFSRHKKSGDRNHWEWTSNSNDSITVFNEDPMQIEGVDDIGVLVHALNLSCFLRFDFYKRRIELRVY